MDKEAMTLSSEQAPAEEAMGERDWAAPFSMSQILT